MLTKLVRSNWSVLTLGLQLDEAAKNSLTFNPVDGLSLHHFVALRAQEGHLSFLEDEGDFVFQLGINSQDSLAPGDDFPKPGQVCERPLHASHPINDEVWIIVDIK